MKFPMILAAMLATAAHADSDRDQFSGRLSAGALSASGFASTGQRGSWSVGAMNESYGFAGLRETHSGLELNTSGGSMSEGFGSNFRGRTGAAGVGGGRGFTGFRGRF